MMSHQLSASASSLPDLAQRRKNWDSSHWMHYSRNNPLLTANCRDYFDRPRTLKAYDAFSLSEPVRVTWKLEPEPRESFGPRKPQALGRSFSGLPEFAQQEADWNDRHHVLHSAANRDFHESDKEYFSIYLASRNRRAVSKRQNGITKHLFPYRLPGAPDGGDDPETAAERIMRADDVVRVPEVPGRLLRELMSAM